MIERYFACVKRFRMLRELLDVHYIKDCDNMWNIACALTNRFCPDLCEDNEHNDNIVARIKDCSSLPAGGPLEQFEKTRGWTRTATDYKTAVAWIKSNQWLN